MPVGLHVIVVLRLALDVHVAGVPVPSFDRGLRAPMSPNAELGVAKPFRHAILRQRIAGAGELIRTKRSFSFRGMNRRDCAGESDNGLASRNGHEESPCSMDAIADQASSGAD